MSQEDLAFNNRNLFSNHYLLNLIQSTPEWKKKEHVEAFNAIKRVYTSQSAFFDGLKESQLEERFYTIIFKKILPSYEVQESSGPDSPDYAFFSAQQSIDDAHRSADSKSFFTGALAIGEVKRWDVELDRFGKDRHDKRRNPSFQMWLYLNETGVNWGILSNGRKWRLYRKDKPLDVYFEVDLAALLEKNDLEGFKYYYYFFRREAFLPNEAGEIFVEKVLKGSADYAKKVGDNLKENVYRAMKEIAEGFFSWPENQLDYNDPRTRELVQKNTMILLYRLLFLLYAEGKGLLDLRNESYRDSHSFDKIKKAVAAKKDGPAQHYYLPTSTSLWGSLKNLFRLIDKGSQELKIDHIIHVPAYNGGLFEADKNRDLDKWTIGDGFLADAIDLLSRSEAGEGGMGFVDYSTLEIRHLGSIYEGLLEYKLMVAESDLVVIGSEKERRWATIEEYNQTKSKKKAFEEFDEFDRARKGELYLTTDKGERKATGSYYTPDYIVNYIVANTIGPVVEERWKLAEENKSSFVDSTLSVKVLDPAMGSGHFLVGAVEFLTIKLMAAAQRDIETGLAEDDGQFTNDWAKREAVSHCVYGVDLNDMAVELAKVSLWLTTISKEKPLSFLDHRLKKGNSLIGARLSDLKNYPGGKRKDENQTSLPSFVSPLFIKNLIGKIKELEGVEEDTLSDIKRKEKIFEEFKALPQYTKAKAIANVHTSLYFGNQIEPTKIKDAEMVYHDMFWGVAGDETEWKRKTWGQWFKQAQEMADQRAFFHWELEFPEIFFEGGAVKENPGWDTVIGNPPYIREETISKDSWFFKSKFDYIFEGKADIYVYFIGQSLILTKNEGLYGIIVSNKWMRAKYGSKLRVFLKDNVRIRSILDFGELPVFSAAGTFPAIILLEKDANNPNHGLFAQIKELPDKKSFDQILDNANEVKILPNHLLKGTWAFDNIEKIKLGLNIEKCSICLKDYVKRPLLVGIKTGLNSAFILDSNKVKEITQNFSIESDIFKPYLIGDDIQKYSIKNSDKYILFPYDKSVSSLPLIDLEKYPRTCQYLISIRDNLSRRAIIREIILQEPNRWYSLQQINKKIDFSIKKIIYPDIGKELRFTIDSDGFFVDMTGFIIESDDLYLLSILNSRLTKFQLNSICAVFGDVEKGGRLRFKSQYLERLLIRRISFSTPESERARMVAELKEHYLSRKFEDILSSVEACLPKDAQGNFITAQEKSDVVHDLLAFLAEQMLEMNKQKQQEIKGFLGWLETEMGAKVDDLLPKTNVQEYYRLQFDELLVILKKNKRKLKDYDPARREPQERLRLEFDASLAKLQPLMERIAATDGLIDQIVYKLYGLTEEEIGIVEGRTS